jgi:putative FmdB family regulatory protein
MVAHGFYRFPCPRPAEGERWQVGQAIRRTFLIFSSQGGPMPQYEFLCKDCKKAFTKFLTIAAYDKETIVCPECGSRNVEQQLSSFYAVTSKKSA